MFVSCNRLSSAAVWRIYFCDLMGDSACTHLAILFLAILGWPASAMLQSKEVVAVSGDSGMLQEFSANSACARNESNFSHTNYEHVLSDEGLEAEVLEVVIKVPLNPTLNWGFNLKPRSTEIFRVQSQPELKENDRIVKVGKDEIESPEQLRQILSALKGKGEEHPRPRPPVGRRSFI